MRCIFCKNSSDSSRSVEHIIPESLGNTKQVLPRGVVCDKCNNYFARKVEKPFLDSSGITELRSFQFIPNKRGNIPFTVGYMNGKHPVQVSPQGEGDVKAFIRVETEVFNKIINEKNGFLIVPTGKLPEQANLVSRFLAKVAVEVLAQRLLKTLGGLDHLIDEPDFDPIRNYARLGQPQEWAYHTRTIYNVNDKCIDLSGKSHKVVYEYDLLFTPHQEGYLILALFGIELAINIGGPDVDGYIAWLTENNKASPLYIGKNKDVI
ncbi:HNH endonuclease [Stenomitos frigidus]|uniref:HNH endonuclease n=1 Tax=Stenomitos frigidus ULC18 TaxID=2107698 RepID=A0A2T1DZA6_9CYAN|nr:HNH endonuclease [Stenomitos frigidus]PSB25828.1 HNH endonuclease [Stenomitos frigidus ULC18]